MQCGPLSLERAAASLADWHIGQQRISASSVSTYNCHKPDTDTALALIRRVNHTHTTATERERERERENTNALRLDQRRALEFFDPAGVALLRCLVALLGPNFNCRIIAPCCKGKVVLIIAEADEFPVLWSIGQKQKAPAGQWRISTRTDGWGS